jgi:hypothetical protein
MVAEPLRAVLKIGLSGNRVMVFRVDLEITKCP